MPQETKAQPNKYRKNFLPTAIISLILWSLLALLIYFFSPQDQFALPVFFLLLFFSLFFSLALLITHTRRGLLLATGITLFLLLRYFGQGILSTPLLFFA